MTQGIGLPEVMDGLGVAGIHQRIAQIEARFQMPAPVATSTAAATTTAKTQAGFAACSTRR